MGLGRELAQGVLGMFQGFTLGAEGGVRQTRSALLARLAAETATVAAVSAIPAVATTATIAAVARTGSACTALFLLHTRTIVAAHGNHGAHRHRLGFGPFRTRCSRGRVLCWPGPTSRRSARGPP